MLKNRKRADYLATENTHTHTHNIVLMRVPTFNSISTHFFTPAVGHFPLALMLGIHFPSRFSHALSVAIFLLIHAVFPQARGIVQFAALGFFSGKRGSSADSYELSFFDVLLDPLMVLLHTLSFSEPNCTNGLRGDIYIYIILY